MALAFLRDFRKKLDKMEDVITSFDPPTFWYSTGNYAVNKAVSGSYTKGIPQGRITCLAGPSGAGKSFELCNILAAAQNEAGAFILALDSENALDRGYMSKLNMKLDEDNFQYAGVTTFSHVVTIVSDFLKSYTAAYGYDNPDSPKVIIALDSLDMLLTDTENDHFNAGDQKGDQGQRAKQAKHMLRTLVSRIKRLPMAFIVTHQVYPNVDIKNGQGAWIVNNAIKYSASQIFLITNGRLKEEGETTGIRMKVEAYKSRFARLGTKVEVEVPYTEGMSKYSGLMELLEDNKIITGGPWKTLNLPGQEPIKFQARHLDEELFKKIMSHPIIADEERTVLELMNTTVEKLEDGPDTEEATVETPKPKRGRKVVAEDETPEGT
jgi:RecA/RadA recombinase